MMETPKYSEENASQCRIVHHKSHMNWPRIEPGPRRNERPATNRLNHGRAQKIFNSINFH
jgi:hypothetical protein